MKLEGVAIDALRDGFVAVRRPALAHAEELTRLALEGGEVVIELLQLQSVGDVDVTLPLEGIQRNCDSRP